MILGKAYHPDTYNCVDFIAEMLAEHGVAFPNTDDCTTATGFIRRIRKSGWTPVHQWPPCDLDMLVLRGPEGLHVGLWYKWRVWHCEGQSQATNWGTIRDIYDLLGIYRHDHDQHS